MKIKQTGSWTDTFSYDLRDGMTTATIGGVTSTYTYDDQNKRVKLSGGGDTDSQAETIAGGSV